MGPNATHQIGLHERKVSEKEDSHRKANQKEKAIIVAVEGFINEQGFEVKTK